MMAFQNTTACWCDERWKSFDKRELTPSWNSTLNISFLRVQGESSSHHSTCCPFSIPPPSSLPPPIHKAAGVVQVTVKRGTNSNPQHAHRVVYLFGSPTPVPKKDFRNYKSVRLFKSFALRKWLRSSRPIYYQNDNLPVYGSTDWCWELNPEYSSPKLITSPFRGHLGDGQDAPIGFLKSISNPNIEVAIIMMKDNNDENNYDGNDCYDNNHYNKKCD